MDGEWLEGDEARIPIDDRGFLYGDGVFDTCRLYEGRWLHFDDHARRLHTSAGILDLQAPPLDALRALADELLERNRGGSAAPELDHAVLRMTLTRGSAPARTAGSGEGARLVMSLQPLAADWRERARRGWHCITATVRHPPAAVMPPQLKGQGRVFSLLASREAERAGCDQALLLSLDGHITEGATWNVFWRHGDIIRTPADSTGILAGVTRSLVMGRVKEAGYILETGVWGRGELEDADEIFGTMTSLGIVPVLELDGRTLPEPRVASDALTPLFWHHASEEQRG